MYTEIIKKKIILSESSSSDDHWQVSGGKSWGQDWSIKEFVYEMFWCNVLPRVYQEKRTKAYHRLCYSREQKFVSIVDHNIL
jgi:hypothetical protein